MAYYTPPLKKVKKQGEMPLPSSVPNLGLGNGISSDYHCLCHPLPFHVHLLLASLVAMVCTI